MIKPDALLIPPHILNVSEIDRAITQAEKDHLQLYGTSPKFLVVTDTQHIHLMNVARNRALATFANNSCIGEYRRMKIITTKDWVPS